MPTKKAAMTSRQFVAALRKLGATAGSKRAAEVLGVTVRQNLRYAHGHQPVPPPIVKLLNALIEIERQNWKIERGLREP